MLLVELQPGTDWFARVTPLELVNLVMRGEVRRNTRSRREGADWTDSAGQQDRPTGFTHEFLGPLERALLSRRLLGEVHAFYGAGNSLPAVAQGAGSPASRPSPAQNPPRKDSPAKQAQGSTRAEPAPAAAPAAAAPRVDFFTLWGAEPLGLHGLLTRVRDLAEWDWSGDLSLRLRILWLVAWLTELTGDARAAREAYQQYLVVIDKFKPRKDGKKLALHVRLGINVEPQLTLLACNNLAVTTLQDSSADRPARDEALRMLAGLAMQCALPGACLSLLNVLDLAWQKQESMGDARALAAVTQRIMEEYENLEWLYERTPGETPPTGAGKEKPAAASPPTAAGPQPAKPQGDPRYKAVVDFWKQVCHAQLHKAKNSRKSAADAAANAPPSSEPKTPEPPPAYWREKDFWRKFADEAARCACESSSPAIADLVAELQLWPDTVSLLFKAPPPRQPHIEKEVSALWQRYRLFAEAVSLLYPRDFADDLPAASPGARPATAQPQPVPDPVAQARDEMRKGRLSAAELLVDELEKLTW